MTITGATQRDISLEDTYKAAKLNPEGIPKHVAIIMDGNGRWAKKRLRPRVFGHRKGVESLRKTIKACGDLNIHYLTVYVFSTENWKRPKKEVSFLMGLLKELALNELPELMAQGARVTALGDLSQLPPDVLDSLNTVIEKTANNTTVQVNLMVNYGGRAEIIRGVKSLAKSVNSGELSVDDITEETFEKTLYTAGQPDPEILIRPGGEFRISNYLLWQLSYSEFFFIDTLWPDFDKETLISVLQSYQNRDRRFGGL